MNDKVNSPVEIPPPGFILNSQAYGTLKWIIQVVLPAFLVFYGSVGIAADIPKTDLVLTILGGFGLFIGTILGFSARNYNNSDARFDGAMNVVAGSAADRDYAGKSQVVLKINKVDSVAKEED